MYLCLNMYAYLIKYFLSAFSVITEDGSAVQAGTFWSKFFTFARGFLHSQTLMLYPYSPIISKGIKAEWARGGHRFVKTFLFQARFQSTLISQRTSRELMQYWATVQETLFQVLLFSPAPRCVCQRQLQLGQSSDRGQSTQVRQGTKEQQPPAKGISFPASC